jgi:hypothetical protein
MGALIRSSFHVSRLTTLAAALAACAGALTTPRAAAAQETGTPVYHAPYRSFATGEMGATVSFVRSQQTGVEGFYRHGIGPVDLALRGGWMILDEGPDGFVLGLDGRMPLISEIGFPLRGALVAGVGLDFRNGTGVWVPVGLSLGRRLTVEHSVVSLVPYLQPTVFFTSVAEDDVGFGLGLGLDLRLSAAFEVRVSGSFGTAAAPAGVAVTATWLK